MMLFSDTNFYDSLLDNHHKNPFKEVYKERKKRQVNDSLEISQKSKVMLNYSINKWGVITNIKLMAAQYWFSVWMNGLASYSLKIFLRDS